jgi:hypothetical protein
MTAAAIPPQKSPSTWLLLALGAAGGLLGYMLSHGVMPFQRVPFERVEIGPDVAAPLVALVLLMAVVLVYGCAGSFTRLVEKLRGIGPGFARWLAPHLAAAASEAQTLGREQEVEEPATVAGQLNPAPAAALPAK